VWTHSTLHGSRLIIAATELMTAVGIGWGFGWAPWASDYSRFTRRELTDESVYWASALGTFIPMIWLGVRLSLGATGGLLLREMPFEPATGGRSRERGAWLALDLGLVFTPP